jgi:hypothetical protein
MYRIRIFSASKGVQAQIHGMKDARSARDEFAKVRKGLSPGLYARLQFTASMQLPWSTLKTARCEP